MYPDGSISAGAGPAGVVGRPSEIQVGEVDKGKAHAGCGSNADAAMGAVLDPDSS